MTASMSNTPTLASTMITGATTSQITTSQNVPSSNRSSIVVKGETPTTIPSALSTVNVTTDTCTSTCVVRQDSCEIKTKLCLWEWVIIVCAVFILIHSIIIGSLCVSKLFIVMLLTTLSNQSRRERRPGGGNTLYLRVTRDGGGVFTNLSRGPWLALAGLVSHWWCGRDGRGGGRRW
jgi:hypothetical protein